MKKIKKFIKKIVPKKYYRKISSSCNYSKSLYLFGFKYHCNFCNGHFRKLLKVGLKNDIAINLIGGDFIIFYVLDVIHRIGKD